MGVVHVSLFLSSLSPVQSNEGQAILDRLLTRIDQAKTVYMEVDSTYTNLGKSQTSYIKLWLKKPKFGRMEQLSRERGPVAGVFTWDGNRSDVVVHATKTYHNNRPEQIIAPMPLFESMHGKARPEYKVASFKRSIQNGKPIVILKVTAKRSWADTIILDAKTNDLLRMTSRHNDVKFDRVSIGLDLSDRLFEYVEPKGYKKASFAAPTTPKPAQVGLKSPNWVIETTSGKAISLDTALKGKKALLLNFWFYG